MFIQKAKIKGDFIFRDPPVATGQT